MRVCGDVGPWIWGVKLMRRLHLTTTNSSRDVVGTVTVIRNTWYSEMSSSSSPRQTTLATSHSTVVFVDVVDVSLDCNDNLTQLNVYDGFSRHPRFLGQVCKGGQVTFESPKYTLYLTFRTRAVHRSRGFRLRSSHTATHRPRKCWMCHHRLVSSRHHFYPYETDANVNCRWLLKAPEGSGVNATLLAADMRGSRQCNNFGLFIYDAVCDNSVRTFQSSGPYLLIVFTSGSLVYHSGGGIKLQYSVMQLDSTRRTACYRPTLFFVITAILLAIIIAVSTVAAIKLFLLPRRRKYAERRRREARARLTRVSVADSQSDLLPNMGDHSNLSSCASLSSCGSTSSNTVDPGPTCQSSGSSISRLLIHYWLKRGRRERGRSCDAVPACGYRRDSSGGVVFGLPGLPPFPYELPPSYEEAMAHPAGLPVEGDSTVPENTDTRPSGQLPVSVLS
ncbi:hypothetical protein BaRGS_00039099 [Batillaria attramentaria]|uniref:CUB domain-containing protein n=1 Tax=Batillaria attramentaria TaxID=370345 RepID=A0ABD0J485_9CAEN